MHDGLITVFGLADDGTTPDEPFIQVVFDGETYNSDHIAIQMGGGSL